MVITALLGGLGNQMFQYAVGRALADRLGVDLKLDLSGVKTDPLRAYALQPYPIRASMATAREIAVLRHPFEPWCAKWWRRLRRIPAVPPASYITGPDCRYDPAFESYPDNVYLTGYWQSEKYFVAVADAIRRDLTPQSPLDSRNAELAERLANSVSVGLHVRRGDYITNPQADSCHGVCPTEYYAAAVRLIEERVSGTEFYAFSDDPEWVRDNLRLPRHLEVLAVNPPEAAHLDLYLMSCCRHQIIANSTFSWWAAWLNPRPDKIVVAPQSWFQDPSIDTSDLVPSAWIRL